VKNMLGVTALQTISRSSREQLRPSKGRYRKRTESQLVGIRQDIEVNVSGHSATLSGTVTPGFKKDGPNASHGVRPVFGMWSNNLIVDYAASTGLFCRYP